MEQGVACRIYKTCKICEKTKYVSEFPKKTGIKRSSGSRKSYCYTCQPRRHEKILPSQPHYHYDTSLLSGSIIKVRGKLTTGHYIYEIPLKEAKQLVIEGAAGIVNPVFIHKIYSREEFRSLIIEQNSHFTCYYCGEYGDTIDHLTPRSKGGLTTPKNCVCSCDPCNQLKGDLSFEKFLALLRSKESEKTFWQKHNVSNSRKYSRNREYVY